jgi:hypothetical protein
MPEPRILYFNHDNPNASGGVRTIYRHVRHLVRNGLPAFVVQGSSRFQPNWFSEDVPTLASQSMALYPEDVVIIPEDHRQALDALKSLDVRKIVFCQNHYYAFTGLGQHRSWAEMGIKTVFASSEVIAGFLQSMMGWNDVPVVHYAVDPGMFKPLKKELQIAYMPRKRPLEANFICNLTTRLLGSAADVRWVPLDGVSETAVAKALGESAIFLSLSRLEGFGLPPVEAMACGCVVVGYHGQGGLEFASPENGFWCEEGDPIACAQLLYRVVDMVRQDNPEVQRVLRGAAATAARYTLERQEQELMQFARSVL